MNPDDAQQLRDIAGPVPLPIPGWVIALIVAGGIIAVALLTLLAIWIIKKSTYRAPLTPRALALQALDKARASGLVQEPRAFSFEVSDILRDYLERQFLLRARKQTSVEFLETLRNGSPFSVEGKELLEQFLERCDRVKYAGLENSAEENGLLLEHARSFVESEPRPVQKP